MGIPGRIRGARAPRTRVFLLGLDGTPHGLMLALFRKGALPNLAEIAGRGGLHRMSTTVPDVSSVAWTTFMTGVNPGRHGIYGFVDLKPDGYRTFFPSAVHNRSPCLWDLIGREARRSVVVNMPSTYPARQLPGVLIAGFVAIDLERATYPGRLVPWLRRIDYRLDVEAPRAREDLDGFLQALTDSLAARERTFLKLLEEEPWDLFAAIVTGTDRLHHFLWDAWEDPGSPHHDAFVDYYRAIDRMVGRLYDALGTDVLFLALSDHGFCGLKRDVYINRWLEEEGHLRFRDKRKRSVEDIDPSRTRAFCLDPGRIYVNAKGRFPEGSVDPGPPCEEVRETLFRELEAMALPASPGGDPGKVIQRVFRKEELYAGPCLHAAPDLVLLPHPGNNLRGATNRTRIFDTEGPFTGMHTRDDAFLLSDRPIAERDDVRILDVSRTVLAQLRSGAAGALEGRNLFEG